MPSQEARLKDLMDDLHASFKDRVREARGDRLAAGRDDELFSGVWCGDEHAVGCGDELFNCRGGWETPAGLEKRRQGSTWA